MKACARSWPMLLWFILPDGKGSIPYSLWTAAIFQFTEPAAGGLFVFFRKCSSFLGPCGFDFRIVGSRRGMADAVKGSFYEGITSHPGCNCMLRSYLPGQCAGCARLLQTRTRAGRDIDGSQH